MKASRLIVIGVIAIIVAVTGYGLVNGTIINNEESGEKVATTQGAASGQSAGYGQSAGAGQGQGQGAGAEGLTVDTEHLQEFEGEVTAENLSASNYFTFTGGGKTYDVNVGARWYWEYKGIGIKPGDTVVVSGFDVQGRGIPTLAASTITNKTTGETITVREKDGTPVWREGSEDECQDSGIGGFSEE